MAKSKVDFKQVLLEHGERIGIGIAGVLAVLMVVMSLFWPGSGVFSGSPTEKAKTIAQVTERVDQKLRDPNNVPGDADKPDKDADKRRVNLITAPVGVENQQVKALVQIDHTGQMGRRLPKVFPIDEGIAMFRHMQVQSYIFDEGTAATGPKVYALRVADRQSLGNTNQSLTRLTRVFGITGGGGATGIGGRGRLGGGPGGGMMGMGGGMMGAGGPGAGMRGGMMGMGGGMMGGIGGMGGPPGMLGAADKLDKELIPVPINKLGDTASVKLAEQVRPVRMAIIGASFPYRKQVEEFKNMLGMRYVNDVLAEPAQEQSPEGLPVGSFRFTGVKVERRELDGDGNPIAPGTAPDRGYEEIDLNKTYRPYVILTGRRYENDDPELRQYGIIVDGLAMPQLMQFREENVHGTGAGGGMPGMPSMPGPGAGMLGGMGMRGSPPGMAQPPRNPDQDKYPRLEKELPLVQKALKELKDKNVTEVARPPDMFNADNLDVFSSRPDAPPPGMGDGGPGKPGGAGMRGGMGMRGATGGMTGMVGGGPPRPGMGEGNPGFNEPAQIELPEYCIVRLVDVTVQPGKTYEYRLRVRMANPNFKRRDVASPEYASKPEILSEWSKMPIKVHVDPEMYYYAVEQSEWERHSDEGDKKYLATAPHRGQFINKDKQVWLQAHRWLESVALKGGASKLEFGEWTIAERLPAYRGEYIGHAERVEVPVWRTTREAFVIAKDTSTTNRSAGIGVYFGFAPDETKQPEALLVDFDNGERGINRVVSRTEDEVKTQKVSDQCGKEVLMMRPDGRLMLLEGAIDFNDEQRVKRVKEVRARILDVKRKEATGGQRLGPGGMGGGLGGGTGSPDG